MGKGKLEVDVETKSSATKFWAALQDSHNLFPKIFPERYQSIDIIEGDGKNVGTILDVKYTQGSGITFEKEKILEVDESSRSFVYAILEGELADLYGHLKASFQISPKGDGSLVKWYLEYEKKSDEVDDPILVKEFAVQTITGLDDHLQNA